LKRYLIASFILHVLIISVALFLVPENRGKETKPFVAKLVTPEELAKKELPEPRKPVPRKEDKRIKRDARSHLSTSEKEVPKNLSSIPKSPSAKKAPISPQALTRELPSKGGSTKALPDINGEEGYRGGHERTTTIKPSTTGRPQAPMREKLFDRDIIAKLSRKEQEGTKEGSAITFDTTEYKYYGYMQRLREKIEGVWSYPREAAARGIYGDLHIKFTIKKNGELGAVELQRTSGYKILDDAALKALRDAAPYWRLPDAVGDSITIPAHFIYVNGVYYLR
jgi:protein TonB